VKQKCLLFSKFNQEDFDSSLKGVDFSCIISELKKLSEKNIIEKCTILEKSYDSIIQSHPKGGADVHYPALMYCIVQSNIPNLITEYQFLMNILPSEMTEGFYGLDTLKKSIDYLKEIRYFLRNEKGELVEFGYFKEKFLQLLNSDDRIDHELVGDLLILVAGNEPEMKFQFDIDYVNKFNN
jgi:hypothetical protein